MDSRKKKLGSSRTPPRGRTYRFVGIQIENCRDTNPGKKNVAIQIKVKYVEIQIKVKNVEIQIKVRVDRIVIEDGTTIPPTMEEMEERRARKDL